MNEKLARVLSINRWYDCLKNEGDRSNVANQLQERRNSSPLEERDILDDILFRELEVIGRYNEALTLIHEIISRRPEDIMPNVACAGLLLHFLEKPDEALVVIERAVALANRSSAFRRLVLGVKARIALKLDRYDLLADVIGSLTELGPREDEPDIDLERDFFDRANPSRLPSELSEKFESLFARSKTT